MSITKQPPVQKQPQPPPPKKRHLVLIGLAAVLAVIVIVVAFEIGNGNSNSSPPRILPTTSAPATPSSPSSTPTTPSPAQQVSAWFAAHGKADLAAVKDDLNAVTADSYTMASDLSAGDLASAEGTDAATLASDGQQLNTDATTALAHQPPAPIADNWVKAMHGLTRVGTYTQDAATALEQGDYNQATVYLNMSNALLTSTVNPALQAATTQVQNLSS